MRMPAAMTWLVLLSIAGAGRAAGERADPCAGAAATAWEIIGERYGGRDFDASSWAAREPAPDDSADTLLLALDDPAVRHLDADQAAALLDQFTGSPRPGVGLFELLSIDASETGGRLVVVTPVPGGPAARAGLVPGDVVLRVAGREPATLHDAMDRLRGAPGGRVNVTLQRERRVFDVELPYEAVDPERMVVRWEVRGPVGVLGIYEFVDGVAERARRALNEFAAAGVRGVVLDLRNDPGGSLEEAIGVADLFLPVGTEVASVRGPSETAEVFTCGEPALWSEDLVVVVNRGSASAAEVVAGALQAAGRATLVGSATFGKGLLHSGQPLGDCGLLMFPVGRLVTPHGRDLLAEGLEPDTKVDPSRWPVLTGDPERIWSIEDLEFQAALARL